jgi:hypothetical protein
VLVALTFITGTKSLNRLMPTLPMSPLKIKIPSKNLGRQRCMEGFNSGVNMLKFLITQITPVNKHKSCLLTCALYNFIMLRLLVSMMKVRVTSNEECVVIKLPEDGTLVLEHVGVCT